MTRLRKGQAYCELELDGLVLVRHSSGLGLPASTTRSFCLTPAEAEAALAAALASAIADGFVAVDTDVMTAAPQLFECTRRGGKIRAARFRLDHSVRRGAAAELAAFLAQPAAAELEELRIGVVPSIAHRYPADDEKLYQPLVDVLTRQPHPTWRTLSLVEEFASNPPCFTSLGGIVLGDVGALYAAAPHLHALHVRANHTLELGEIALAELRELAIETDDGFTPSMIRSVSRLRCPKLQRLELRFGRTTHTPAELAPLFDATMPPTLQHVALTAVMSAALVAPLAAATFLPKLKTLSLCSGALDAAGARELVRHEARFAHLKALDLEGDRIFDAAARTALTTALPRVDLGMQIRF